VRASIATSFANQSCALFTTKAMLLVDYNKAQIKEINSIFE
jgi:hypothetical protein